MNTILVITVLIIINLIMFLNTEANDWFEGFKYAEELFLKDHSLKEIHDISLDVSIFKPEEYVKGITDYINLQIERRYYQP